MTCRMHSHPFPDDLFERPEDVEVLHSFRAGLLPPELWKWYNHMQPERARRRNPISDISDDLDGRSLYVTTAYRLESDPAVDVDLYRACLRELPSRWLIG